MDASNDHEPESSADIDAELRRLECAADEGNTIAMYNLAVLYKHEIKPRDMKTSRQWFERAAEARLDLGQVNAGSFARRAWLRVRRAGKAMVRWSES